MKRKNLEIELEDIKGFRNPSPRLEQYETPPELASHVLHVALLNGDIRDNTIVIDLGCGTGILAIGAALIGARSIGLDLDRDVLEIAKENADIFDVEKQIKWIHGDVRQHPFKPIQEKKRTVIMNPPFGSQKRGADRPFLNTAEKIGDVIYTIHNEGSLDFVEAFTDGEITHAFKASIDIPKKFYFHQKKVEETEVEVYRIR